MVNNIAQLVEIRTKLSKGSFTNESLDKFIELLNEETDGALIGEINYIKDNERLQEVGIPKIIGIIDSRIKEAINSVEETVRKGVIKLNDFLPDFKETKKYIDEITGIVDSLTEIDANDKVTLKLDASFLSNFILEETKDTKKKLNYIISSFDASNDVQDILEGIQRLSNKSKLLVLNNQSEGSSELLDDIEMAEVYEIQDVDMDGDDFTLIDIETLQTFYAGVTNLTNKRYMEINAAMLQGFSESIEDIVNSIKSDISEGVEDFIEQKILYINVIVRYINNLYSAQEFMESTIETVKSYVEHLQKGRLLGK